MQLAVSELSVTLSSTVGKEVVVAAFRLCRALQKMAIPQYGGQLFNQKRPIDQKVTPRHSGQLLNTSTDRVKMEKKASCFTLLKRITRLKCVNSEIKSNVKSCCLARHSPKGSYHLVEPAGRTHLYRKAIRICNVRAKNKQNRHDETNEYIYIYK